MKSLKDILRCVLYPFVIARRYYIFTYLAKHNPKAYAAFLFKQQFGHKLNYKNPQDLNEKANWAKFYSDTSRWTELADKYAVRGYLQEKGLEHMLVKLYGVWDNPDDINFEQLPHRFILKTNHGSGTIIVVNNKSLLDIATTKDTLKQWISQPYGLSLAEPWYLSIPPKIIAEELLDATKQSAHSTSLIDYKFFCANGEPQCCMIYSNRCNDFVNIKLYDMEWNDISQHLIATDHYLVTNQSYPRPHSFTDMVSAVRKLADGIPQVWIDCYEVGGTAYFGEITFSRSGGFIPFFSKEYLIQLGQTVHLPTRS